MGKARMYITLDFLVEFAKNTGKSSFKHRVTGGLPEDARLIDIEVKDTRHVLATIESEFFEDMPIGADVPTIKPTFHKIIEPYSWEPK